MGSREELWQPEPRRGGSRSPRRRGSSTRSPIGGADAEELFTTGSGSSGGLSGGMSPMAVMGMPQQMMMRQMAMMNAGNPMAQQAMMRQQMMMRQFQQQMMMGQMGAMQQMMNAMRSSGTGNGGTGGIAINMQTDPEETQRQMGAMQQMMMRQQEAMANAMRTSGAGNGGSGGITINVQTDPEETQRQMGRQAYANAVAAMNRRDQNDDDDDVPSGPSSSVHHPNYRPPDAEPVPGLTDKRFEGRLKLWFEDKGYGFIECNGIKQFPDVDVFLHQNQKRHFWRGAWISFGVFLNFRGKPQATELRLAKDPAEESNATTT